MFFSRLFGGQFGEPRYIRRSRAYLEEARMATLEHSVAAEHYLAMAQMYADRAARLEEEIRAWEAGERYAPELPQVVHPAVRPRPQEVVPPAGSGNPAPVGVVRAA